ncbi:MAG: proteasome assembly chaperone family protein [Actinomycetales bacterium]
MNDFDYVPFLDPESLYALNPGARDSENKGLNLLLAFDGLADAGQVVTQIRSELVEKLPSTVLGYFDVDQLLDYRSRRPRISFVEDHLTAYRAPRLVLYRMQDGLGQPFLFLTGPEPDLQWERFSEAVVSLVRRLDVNLVAWVQAVPMPVPHTRPIGVTVHGNRPELIEGITSWRATIDLPSGIGHVVEVRLSEAGRNVAGYALHVPHYLAEAQYPQAAVAGLEYLGAAASLMLPTDQLREAGREVERQIGEQVAGSVEVQGVVRALEEQYDERVEGLGTRSLLADQNDRLPTADALGAAVEAYLASREDDGGRP